MTTMHPRHSTRLRTVSVLGLLTLLTGCELIAAIDRDKIADDSSTTSSTGGAGGATSSSAGGSGGNGGATSSTGGSGGMGGSTAASGGGGNGGAGGSAMLKGLGESCAVADECTSGFCADGFCCDSSCDGACSSCSQAKGASANGQCTGGAVKNAQDAGACDDTHGDCGGACTCDADAFCVRKTPQLTAIASGADHSCALFDDGSIKCWGRNHVGQLGYGDTNNRGDLASELGDALPFVDLGANKKAKALALGTQHTCALLTDGLVKCWGASSLGQLGTTDNNPRGDGPNEMGDNLAAVKLGTGKKAIGIVAGGSHTCARLEDSTVKCWGLNASGQLGYGDTDNRGGDAEMGDNLAAVSVGTGKKATSLSAGMTHTCAVLDDGSLKCWGGNAFGQLGYGDTNARGDGPNEMGDNLPAIAMPTALKAKSVKSGLSHNCAVLDDGSVRCWGENGRGQLGYGDTNARGDGPNEMGDNLLAVQVGASKKATQLTAAGLHSCALLDDQTLKCWGANESGQLGYGDTNARGDEANEMGSKLNTVPLGSGVAASVLTAGAAHTCAQLASGAVKCWGLNVYGQLGQGDASARGDNPNELGDLLLPIRFFGN